MLRERQVAVCATAYLLLALTSRGATRATAEVASPVDLMRHERRLGRR